MKCQLKIELKKWEKDYLQKKRRLENEYPYRENKLNNRHPLNELNKRYFEKKRKIIEKYDIQNK